MRELRLIAEHKPRYNRRSRFPEKMHFIKLTREPWPRLSLVARVLEDDADYLGPFSSKKAAESCLSALHETFPVRQCTDRLARRPSRTACVLAEMGKCLAPCDGSVDEMSYAAVVRQLRDTLLRRPDDVVETINHRMSLLAADERFEEAGTHRDRLASFVRAAARTQRLSALSGCPEVVAARREDDGRWAVHVVRHGRLAGAGVIPPATDAHGYVDLAAGRRRDRARPHPARCRPPAPRRPRRSCAGWSRRRCAWSTSPASGPARSPAPVGHLAVHDAVADSRRAPRARAEPLPWPRDHRHRLRQGRRRPHPRGGRGRSPPSTGSPRSTPSPARSTSSPWSGSATTTRSPPWWPTGSTRSPA